MAEVPFPSPALARCIAALPELPIVELPALWLEAFGKPPVVANRRFLERRIAYHWQATACEALHPGVLARQRERIAEFAMCLDSAKQPRYRPLSPGVVLVRSFFNGAEYQVRVLEGDQFEYAGKRYGSLSEVARVITGTRWSGPRFFGLTARTGLNCR